MAVAQRTTEVGDALAERLAGINILLINSSDRAANLIQKLFTNLGFVNLHIARDAAKALQSLRDQRFHFMVTDVDLNIATAPKASGKSKDKQELRLSGIELVQRLRNHRNSPAPFIPVLMLMDYAHSSEVARARDAGINEIVLKPLQAYDFCSRIIALVDKPRIFVTSITYRGPCRRRGPQAQAPQQERRTHEVRLVRCNEVGGDCS